MASKEPPAKKIKLDISSFSPPIKVIVGKEKTEFHISKALICAHSDFFKLACSEQWEFGRTNTITLEEDQPEEFSIFLTWILTKRFGDAAAFLEYPRDNDKSNEDPASEAENRLLQLCRCFVLGEVLQAVAFRNAIIDAVVEHIKTVDFDDRIVTVAGSSSTTLKYVYENTSQDSGLRRILVDNFIAADDAKGNVKRDKLNDNLDFFLEVLNYSLSHVYDEAAPIDVWDMDPCTYHQHPGEVEGYSCTKSRKKRIRRLE